MMPIKAIVLSLSMVLLFPFWACSQQNGSKNPPKTQKKGASVQKKPAAKPAANSNNKSAGNKGSAKKAVKPAPPEIQKIYDELMKEKEQQQKEESRLIYEIDGLLIDESLTKTGHDFYDIFYSAWEAPEEVRDYTVRIIERPLRGRGFQIIVSVNDVEIIEQNLQPRYDMLEEAALEAVNYTRGYLLNNENLKNQIESDDQKGTGLF